MDSKNVLARYYLGETHLRARRPDDAIREWEAALAQDHTYTPAAQSIGELWMAKMEYAKARPYFERALAIWEKVLGAEHPDAALSLNNLGGLLRRQGDLAAARSYYERALAIFEARLGPDHPSTKIVRKNLAALGEAEST